MKYILYYYSLRLKGEDPLAAIEKEKKKQRWIHNLVDDHSSSSSSSSARTQHINNRVCQLWKLIFHFFL